MALEDLTGSKFIGALNPAWPDADDWLDEGDDHIRGIKNVLVNQFPNLGNTPVQRTAAQLNAGVLPVGSLLDYCGNAMPGPEWLECQGQAISRANYPDLFAILGVVWGAGDGSTTFNIPDLRGRVVIGRQSLDPLIPANRGSSGGAPTHTLAAAESGMPAHNHSANVFGAAGLLNGIYEIAAAYDPLSLSSNNVVGNAAAVPAAQAHNNMQPFNVVVKIIRALP